MAVIRSPNYPSMSLPEAIARVAVVHEKEQHLAAPREVVAAHMGFKSLNGSSLKALSSLLKYGLLEKVAGDQRRVTDLAVRILHPIDEADKRAAIIEAAGRPTLFKEIANNWPNGTPSDENLKSWLIRRQFSADAIQDVIKAYRDTMELVAHESGTRDSPLSARNEQAKAPAASPVSAGISAQASGAQHTSSGSAGATDAYRVTFTPSGLEVSARLSSGADLKALVRALSGLEFLFLKPSEIPQPQGYREGDGGVDLEEDDD